MPRLSEVARTQDADIAEAFRDRGMKTWILPSGLDSAFRRNPTYATDPHALAEEPLRSPSLSGDQRLPEPIASQLRTIVALHDDARLVLAPVELRIEAATGGQRGRDEACCDSCSSTRARRPSGGSATSPAIPPRRSGRAITASIASQAATVSPCHSRRSLTSRQCRLTSRSFLATASGRRSARATVKILAAAGADIEWDTQVAGMAGVARYGDPIPDSTLDSIKRTKLALKGPLETPVGEGFRSINVALRKDIRSLRERASCA